MPPAPIYITHTPSGCDLLFFVIMRVNEQAIRIKTDALSLWLTAYLTGRVIELNLLPSPSNDKSEKLVT